MTALAVMEWAASEGVVLSGIGGHLKVVTSRPPPAQLLERLRQYKPEILDVLLVAYQDNVSAAAGVPYEWLEAHYFTSEDLTDIHAGKYPDAQALGRLIRTDTEYPFGFIGSRSSGRDCTPTCSNTKVAA